MEHIADRITFEYITDAPHGARELVRVSAVYPPGDAATANPEALLESAYSVLDTIGADAADGLTPVRVRRTAKEYTHRGITTEQRVTPAPVLASWKNALPCYA